MAVATNGKNHVRNGWIALTNELSAILCNTPGKRIGRPASNAATELYTNPRPAKSIVRRHNRVNDGLEMLAENPAQRRKVGNIV